MAFSAGDDKVARAWLIPPPVEGSLAEVRRWVESLTGSRRQADGSTSPLTRTEWLEARAERPRRDESLSGWHRQEAAQAEQRERWQTVVWHLDRLLTEQPRDVGLLLRRARGHASSQNFRAAREDLDQAVELSPKAYGALHRRGQLSLQQGRWPEAIDDLSNALKALPRREAPGHGYDVGPEAEVLRDRAYAQASQDRYDKAAEDLALVVRIQDPWMRSRTAPPTVIRQYAEYALVRLKLEDPKGHAAACQAIFTAFADGMQSDRYRLVTGEFGRRDVYVLGAPLDADTSADVAWVCCLAPDGQALQLALQLARQAAAAEPDNYFAARSLASALVRAGQTEAALAQIKKAAGLLDKPSPSLLLLSALAWHRAGEAGQARHALAQAKKWIDDARVAKADDDPSNVAWSSLPWMERVALEVLLSQAETLVKKPD
jgi:tetratricopeptide (TPR) repeat protein